MLNATKGEICDNYITISVSKMHNSGVKIKPFLLFYTQKKRRLRKPGETQGSEGRAGREGDTGRVAGTVFSSLPGSHS